MIFFIILLTLFSIFHAKIETFFRWDKKMSGEELHFQNLTIAAIYSAVSIVVTSVAFIGPLVFTDAIILIYLSLFIRIVIFDGFRNLFLKRPFFAVSVTGWWPERTFGYWGMLCIKSFLFFLSIPAVAIFANNHGWW